MDHCIIEIGKRIREERVAQKLNQEQLAEMAGVTAQYISNIEHGNQKMSVLVFSKICEALDVSADKLLYNSSTVSRVKLSEESEEMLSDCSPLERRSILHLVQEFKDILNKLRETQT